MISSGVHVVHRNCTAARTLQGINIALPLIVLGMTGSITGSSKKSAGPSKRCTSRRGQFCHVTKQMNDNPSLHNTGSVYSVRIMKRMAYTSPNKVSGQWWRPFIQSLHPLQWVTMSFDQKKVHFKKCLFRKFTLDHQCFQLPHEYPCPSWGDGQNCAEGRD